MIYYDLHPYVEYPGAWFLGDLMFRGDEVYELMFCQGEKVEPDSVVLSVLRPEQCVVPGHERAIIPRNMAERNASLYSDVFPLEKGWEQELVLPVEEEGISLDYSHGFGMMPIINKHLAEELLKLAHDDIQLFPVKILGHEEEYFIMNVIQVAECVDERRSRGILWKPGMAGDPRRYSSLSEIHIDPTRTSGHKLFRLKHWEMVLICSEEIKDLFDRMEAQGALFRPVM